MESGGLDSTSGPEGEGESVSVSEGNVEIEIDEENIEKLSKDFNNIVDIEKYSCLLITTVLL